MRLTKRIEKRTHTLMPVAYQWFASLYKAFVESESNLCPTMLILVNPRNTNQMTVISLIDSVQSTVILGTAFEKMAASESSKA